MGLGALGGRAQLQGSGEAWVFPSQALEPEPGSSSVETDLSRSEGCWKQTDFLLPFHLFPSLMDQMVTTHLSRGLEL